MEEEAKLGPVDPDGIQLSVVVPGLVVMKRALTKEDQIFWAKYAMQVGEDEKQGFWFTNRKGEKLPNLIDRGRVYDRVSAYKHSTEVSCVWRLLILSGSLLV